MRGVSAVNTATQETLAEVELDLDARKALGRELQVADHVYQATNPAKDLGTVAKIEGGRYFVTWHRTRRTWIYPSAHLVLVGD
jgi:hypothetical protein